MEEISKKPEGYIGLMNRSLTGFLRDVVKVCAGRPSMAYFVYKLLRKQREAEKIRRYWEGQGVHVPPYMIASITNSCNLRCKGCYARAHHRAAGQELTELQWRSIFNEARELGISIIFLAGGEPFTRPDVLGLTADYREIVFPVFTNGTMLDDSTLKAVKKQKNLIPILSIEGFKSDTDERRGRGVFENIQNAMKRIRENGMFFGVSVTATSKNMDNVTGNEFITSLIDSGCKLFMYIEYVAVEESTEHLLLSSEQRSRLLNLMGELHKRYRKLFVSFPGDEEKFGGCLAAGRGFVHVSPDGGLEPCPFSPYCDASLKDMPLKEALKSDFLKNIRQHHDKLTETKGGCALWNNRDWVKSILGAAEEKSAGLHS